MCEPATIIAGASLLATAAGTAAQIKGQSDARKAQKSAVAAEITRQGDTRRHQLESIANTTNGIDRQSTDAATQEGAASRGAEYSAASAPAGTEYLPGQANAPQVVRDAVDQKQGAAGAYVGQQGQALANLGGWSDALFGTRRKIARNAQGIGIDATDAKASASLLGTDLAGAGFDGMGMRTAGDIGVAAGTLGAGAGQQLYDGGAKLYKQFSTPKPTGAA